MRLTSETQARRLSNKFARATGWEYETWVVHESGNPGASIVQVEIYRHKGEWYGWGVSTTLRNQWARVVAKARNEGES